MLDGRPRLGPALDRRQGLVTAGDPTPERAALDWRAMQELQRNVRRLLIASLGLLAILASALSQAAPRAELWDRWLAHDPDSMQQIDHAEWDAFLTRYLRIGADGVHRVAYGEVTPEGRAELDGYIARLAAVPIGQYNRPEQMVYWINLYNALVVRLVLDHYPIASIRDVQTQPGAAGAGPWREGLIEVEGTPLSLHDIAHRILRPIWRDPRVHYALACGAVGCPNLQPAPFAAGQLEHQLSEAAMAYVNDPRCIRIEGDHLGLSSLYRWYRDDFGATDRDVINHLMAYAEPDLAMKLQRFDRISGDGFDWRLNDAAF
jgi:Protein of unknown function, DUF547